VSDGEVISLASGERVTVITRHDGFCQSRCQNVRVDTHLRQIVCRECGAVVELFNWVYRMAAEESNLIDRITRLRNEATIHQERVSNLEAEEKRIKARIRSAKDSLIKAAGV